LAAVEVEPDGVGLDKLDGAGDAGGMALLLAVLDGDKTYA